MFRVALICASGTYYAASVVSATSHVQHSLSFDDKADAESFAKGSGWAKTSWIDEMKVIPCPLAQ